MAGMSAGPSQYAFGSLALFIKPLSEEFGWDRANITLATTFFTLALMFSLPVAGRIADAVGTKRLLIPSMLVVGISLATIPLLVSAPWHLWAIFAVIGCLGAGANALPYMRTVSAWFDRRRGLAIGVTLAGAGLGYTYVPPLLHITTESYGWRASYFVLAGLTCFVAVPLVVLFFREAPSELKMRSPETVSQPAADDLAIDRNNALRSRTFWKLFAIFGLLSFSLYGLMIHSVSMLTDRGMSMENAAYGASLIGITITFSRIVIGYLCDRFFVPRIAAAAFAASTIGLLVLAFGASGAPAYFALILIAFSIGAEIDMMTFLTTRYFGIRHFGEIYGILFASLLIGTSLGPWLFGRSFDASGSYIMMLWIAAGLTGIAATLCFALPSYSKTGQ